MLEFRILGPFEVVDADRPLSLGGPRQRALLAILLLHRGHVVSSDRLIDELWGERAPATAAKTLQGYVSHLRKALGDGVLLTRGGGYTLLAERVDADRFEALVEEARGADARRARELLGAALALWRGDPLGDLAYEPFAATETARLEEARLGALEDRLDADLALGRHRAVAAELEALVAEHPSRERLLAQLMLALYRSGRQADALEAYRRGRRALHDELGLEPAPELRALEQRILTHDPGLAPRAPSMRAGPRRRPLLALGGALMLAAAIAAALVELAGGTTDRLRAVPNSVAVIDSRSDRVLADVPVGARPGALTFGSGSLWVANQDDQTVSRVDPRTLQTLRALPAPAPPTALAATPGAVWVAGSIPGSTSAAVARIDPLFDAVRRPVRLGNAAPGLPTVAAAGGGALWVAPYGGTLERLDPGTGRVVAQLDPNAAPTGIAVGAGGVWLTDADADDVTRIDRTGFRRSVAVGDAPSGIAIGYGAVWVADTADDAVVRIDPDEPAVVTTIPVGAAPAGVATGAGSVWVADSGDGTVTRIDPRTNRPRAPIAVGGSPAEIDVVGRRAWVTVDSRTVPGGRPSSGGTARLDGEHDVDYLDPALAYGGASWQLLYATCAKLLNYADRAGTAGSRLVPEVAQSLPARSADGRTYTFTIRPGFRFSPPSNTPVTAQTFKDSLERSLDPRMKSPVAADFADIAGARAYMAGRARHIAGLIARGDKLIIRLTAPAPDLPARTTEPAFCAVPSGTPVDPSGERVIPSAGPYRVASYTPGQGVVLTRNPNYHGSRPHRLARIELTDDVGPRRAIAQVEAGTADYALDGPVNAAQAARLAARFGPRSGHQQYFNLVEPQLDFFALNSHRPLFAGARLRRAVSYAVDRSALARLGDEYSPLPEHPTDHYIPPGLAGYSDVRIYPLRPEVATARRLARRHAGATVVLYTCDRSPCAEQAQILRTDLAAIGLRLEVEAFPDETLAHKLATPGEPFDMAWEGWLPNYMDPDAFLNALIASDATVPSLADPAYRARLAAAARLSGPRRYLTYARLDADLARHAAPLVAFGNLSAHVLLSARMGCEVQQPIYGIDLAALCLNRG
jgi:YVTN family beta-propeller protein